MGTCSYTWKEWDEEKGEIEKRCRNETWGGSDKFCIFHDPSLEKDANLFEKKLEKQMQAETERHNFIGYCFPAHWDFSDEEFEIGAYFSKATFQDADFFEATLQDADFRDVTFQGYAYFSKATFQDAYFSKATFQDAIFRVVTVRESFNFNPKEVSGIIDLRKSKFFFSGSITANLEKAKFYHAHLQDVAFIDCTWPKNYVIYEEKKMKDEAINLTFKELETIYRDLKQNMQNHGDYTTAGEFYYREMEMRRKGAETKKKRFSLLVGIAVVRCTKYSFTIS